MVSIETLNLDTSKSWSWQFKNDISTNLDNFYAIKSRFVSIFIFVSIESLDLDISKSWSRPSRKSRQVLKTGLDAKDVLDLDWSRLSRPPTLSLFLQLNPNTMRPKTNLEKSSLSFSNLCLDLRPFFSVNLWPQNLRRGAAGDIGARDDRLRTWGTATTSVRMF